MRLEDLKRWHWAIIGVAVGGVFGLMRLNWNEPGDGAFRSLPPVEFERFLLAHATSQDELRSMTQWRRGMRAGGRGVPVIKNITIDPPASDGRVFVTAEFLRELKPVRPDPKDLDRLLPAEAQYGKVYMVLPSRSYKPGAWYDGPPDPELTIEKYLAHVKAARPEARWDYRYAWWKTKPMAAGTGAAAGLLLIGGVWPTVIALLTGAGFGRPPRREKAYDLDRFSHAPDPAKPAAAGVTPGQEEALRHHVEELEGELLSDLRRADAVRMGEPVPEERPVRELTTAPLEATPVADHSKDDVEFTGEFYPVAHKVTKKHDEPRP